MNDSQSGFRCPSQADVEFLTGKMQKALEYVTATGKPLSLVSMMSPRAIASRMFQKERFSQEVSECRSRHELAGDCLSLAQAIIAVFSAQRRLHAALYLRFENDPDVKPARAALSAAEKELAAAQSRMDAHRSAETDKAISALAKGLKPLGQDQQGTVKVDIAVATLLEAFATLEKPPKAAKSGTPQPNSISGNQPEGGIHCLVRDLASFVKEQWASVGNDPDLRISEETYKKIFQAMALMPIQSTRSLPAKVYENKAVPAVKVVANMGYYLSQAMAQGGDLIIEGMESGTLRVQAKSVDWRIERCGNDEFRSLWFDGSETSS